jgi:uncharacterized membrane protein YoaK (UPF0700 family)
MLAVEENRWTLPLLLSFTAGHLDTAGFLALQGFFTAHVTGNFVTLGASLALGTSEAVAKLLALRVFCAVVSRSGFSVRFAPELPAGSEPRAMSVLLLR